MWSISDLVAPALPLTALSGLLLLAQPCHAEDAHNPGTKPQSYAGSEHGGEEKSCAGDSSAADLAALNELRQSVLGNQTGVPGILVAYAYADEYRISLSLQSDPMVFPIRPGDGFKGFSNTNGVVTANYEKLSPATHRQTRAVEISALASDLYSISETAVGLINTIPLSGSLKLYQIPLRSASMIAPRCMGNVRLQAAIGGLVIISDRELTSEASADELVLSIGDQTLLVGPRSESDAQPISRIEDFFDTARVIALIDAERLRLRPVPPMQSQSIQGLVEQLKQGNFREAWQASSELDGTRIGQLPTLAYLRAIAAIAMQENISRGGLDLRAMPGGRLMDACLGDPDISDLTSVVQQARSAIDKLPKPVQLAFRRCELKALKRAGDFHRALGLLRQIEPEFATDRNAGILNLLLLRAAKEAALTDLYRSEFERRQRQKPEVLDLEIYRREDSLVGLFSPGFVLQYLLTDRMSFGGALLDVNLLVDGLRNAQKEEFIESIFRIDAASPSRDPQLRAYLDRVLAEEVVQRLNPTEAGLSIAVLFEIQKLAEKQAARPWRSKLLALIAFSALDIGDNNLAAQSFLNAFDSGSLPEDLIAPFVNRFITVRRSIASVGEAVSDLDRLLVEPARARRGSLYQQLRDAREETTASQLRRSPQASAAVVPFEKMRERLRALSGKDHAD